MKVVSVIVLLIVAPMMGIISGCSDPPPSGLNETVHYSGKAEETSLFSGKKTTLTLNLNLTITAVLYARNSSVDSDGSLIMVLARIRNTGREPLSIPVTTFVLQTESGNRYNAISGSFSSEEWPGSITHGRTWGTEVRDLGPNSDQNVLFSYRVPFGGLGEKSYFSTPNQRLINIGIYDADKWEVHDSYSEVRRIHYLVNP